MHMRMLGVRCILRIKNKFPFFTTVLLNHVLQFIVEIGYVFIHRNDKVSTPLSLC